MHYISVRFAETWALSINLPTVQNQNKTYLNTLSIVISTRISGKYVLLMGLSCSRL